MGEKRQKNKPDNSIRLLLSVSGSISEISSIDIRKYELINYYLADDKNSDEKQTELVEHLSQNLSKSFNESIDKEYKKHVPSAVRKMYDGLLANSAAFGARDSEENEKAEEKYGTDTS